MAIANALRGLDEAKAARLAEIHRKMEMFPGRAVNGTGETGLMPNDAKGYSDMLNEQTEAMNLENEASGRAPVRVLQGGEYASQHHGIADDPTSSFNTSSGPYGKFGAGTGGESASILPTPAGQLASLSAQAKPPMPESHDAFMARLVKQYGAR